METNGTIKVGSAAVVGRTNVGKSALLNRLVGHTVSAVAAVGCTTRNCIRGILTRPAGQIVFVDTPGTHVAKHDLGILMNKTARATAEAADMVLLVMDTTEEPSAEDDSWMRRLLFMTQPCVFLLNKSDLPSAQGGRYQNLWNALQKEKNTHKDVRWHAVSAVSGLGLREVVDDVFGHLPVGTLRYTPGTITDAPRSMTIADIIRAQLYAYLRDEMPGTVAVRIETLAENDGQWTVEATILVERSVQMGAVLGNRGRALKQAKAQATEELAALLQGSVALTVWVDVEPNWTQNYFLLKELGYAG